MATLLWVDDKFNRKYEMYDSILDPRGVFDDRYIIAKGNVIEGIEAKW